MGVASTIAKNTMFNFVATASDLVINFVVGIVLARSLGTEQYGQYAFLMWFLGFALMAINLGLNSMVTRFVAEALGRQATDEPKALVRLMLMMRGLAALLISAAILVFSGFWAKTFTNSGSQIYFILLGFALLPQAMNFAFISIFAGFQKYEYSAYLTLGSNPLRLALIIVLVILGFGLQEILIANIIAWVAGTLIGIFVLRRIIPLKVLLSPSPLNPALKKSALKYALTMTGVLGLSYFLWQQAEVLLLGLYRPVEEVGFYTLASKLPWLSMMLIPSVFGAVLLPAIAEQFGKGDMEKLKKIYLTAARYLMMLALPLAAGGIALASPIISLLYGADYAPVITLMQILFIPFAMVGICYAATGVIQGTNQPAFIIKVELFLVCLNIGLNLWFIPRYGVLGAAIASSVPRLLILPFYIRFISRRIGTAWPIRDTIKIAMAALIMGLAVYVLQSQLGVALSLALGIPMGIVLYVVGILSLRVIRQQDVHILKGGQTSLPQALQKSYTALIGLVERIILLSGHSKP